MAAPTTAPVSTQSDNLEQYAEKALGADHMKAVTEIFGPNAAADLAIAIFTGDEKRDIAGLAATALHQDVRKVLDAVKPADQAALVDKVGKTFGDDAKTALETYYKAHDKLKSQALGDFFDKFDAGNKKNHTIGSIMPKDNADLVAVVGAEAATNKAIHDYVIARSRESKGSDKAIFDKMAEYSARATGTNLSKGATVIADGGPEGEAVRAALKKGVLGKTVADDVAGVEGDFAAIKKLQQKLGSDPADKLKADTAELQKDLGKLAADSKKVVQDESKALLNTRVLTAAEGLKGLGITAVSTSSAGLPSTATAPVDPAPKTPGK